MPSDTYRFRCVNPDCQKTQSRRLGHGPNAGNYVTCKFCKAPNPGPKMTAVLTAAGHRTGSELEERTKNKRRRRQSPVEQPNGGQPATAGPATDRQTAPARRARTVVKGGGRTRQPAAPTAPAPPAPPAPPPAAPPAPAEEQQHGWGHRLMYGNG